MAGSLIDNTLYVGVTLGNGGYNSPLTITAVGAIAPGASYSIALYNSLVTGYALNQGGIIGRPSSGVIDAYVQPGTGVEFTAGTFANAGTVTGGAVTDGFYDAGIGVYLKGAARLLNSGKIYGGAGANDEDGATGVRMTGGYALNAAAGTITGGNYNSGFAGDGVSIKDGTFVNHGSVTGGTGYFAGNSGYSGAGYGGFSNGGTVLNYGNITGGIAESDEAGGGWQQEAGTFVNFGTIIGSNGGRGFAADGGSLNNQGVIAAGDSDSFFQGGAEGVYVSSVGMVNNSGTITGNVNSYRYGVGGVGAEVVGGTIVNTGTIAGGYGSLSSGGGIFLGSGIVSNQGTILGGAGARPNIGVDVYAGTIVNGPGAVISGTGSGIDVIGPGTIDNSGLIYGGQSGLLAAASSLTTDSVIINEAAGTITGGNGGFGVNLTAVTIENRGTIAGGTATATSLPGYGGEGAQVTDGGIINSSRILGGDANGAIGTGSGMVRASGGIGVSLSSASVTNSAAGTIAGGNGGVGAGSFGSSGGIGIYVLQSTFDNAGLIKGGSGAYGQVISGGGAAGASLFYGYGINTGMILGGSGAPIGAAAIGTDFGGAGVDLDHGSFDNAGLIMGGSGGAGPNGGIGQFGVLAFYATSTLVNTGTIIGGSGGAGTTIGGVGAGAVYIRAGGLHAGYLRTGVFTNAGTVIGGAGGTGVTVGAAGDAVDFGGFYAGTLVVEHGAVFEGAVVSNASYANLLELTAGPSWSLDMGGSFSGFADINFDAGASWLLGGDEAELAAGQTITGFTIGDTIDLAGFTASSGSYVTGGGLVISNGASTETLGIAGSFAGNAFTIATAADGTLIELGHSVASTGSITIGGTDPYPQLVTDGQGIAPLSGVTITDTNAGAQDSATIILTANGTATSDDGILTGAGLTTLGGGTYALASATPAALQAELRALVFTPGLSASIPQGAAASASISSLLTGLTIQISDGIAPAMTDTNTTVDALLGTQPLSLIFGSIPGDPGGFTSGSRTGETSYATTSISNLASLTSTTITASDQNGIVFSETFALPYSDSTVQAAIAQADVTLMNDGYMGSSPSLASSLITYANLQMSTLVTGVQIGTATLDGVTNNFGPGTPFPTATDVNGTPSSSFTLLAGQTDLNANYDYATTVDQTIITTGTQLTAEDYEITAICYLRGTKILTPAGEVPIEALCIGDAVITRHNGYQKIKWIGRQSFGRAFIARNRDQLPVRIAAGALGGGRPLRDLFVSPGHSMLLNDILVLAKTLVNGVTITQDEAPAEIHYYQLEFEQHDGVLAAGAWSESFADGPGLRGMFHNAATFYELYPHYQTPLDVSLCRPRPEQGAALDAALRPITALAMLNLRPGKLYGWIDHIDTVIEGWAQDADHPELPVMLEIFLGEQRLGTVLACGYRHDLAAAGLGRGWCQFSFVLPRPLSVEVCRTIRVVRQEDGAEISMSADCRIGLGINTSIQLQDEPGFDLKLAG